MAPSDLEVTICDTTCFGCLLMWFDFLRLSQQFFIHVRTALLRLTSTKQRIKCIAQ